MIKFIVIEDDLAHQEKVKSILRKITFNNEEEVKIFTYEKYSSKLREEIQDKATRKIFIIDIELQNNCSGVQIAKAIRENDWESEIIFMTNHDKMFETVYRNVYKVFDFIEKFHNFETRLEKDVKEILRMNFDNKMFVYRARNIDLHLYYKEILYIYRDTEDRKIIIVTTKNKFSLNSTIQDTLERLDKRFKLVHRACIVNLDRVQKFDWKNKFFILDNGVKVDLLSKKYRKEVESR